MAGPLWADLLNKEVKISNEQVLLLTQRALVLLGSVSHQISQDRRKIAWGKINPKLKSLADEEYAKREINLFGPGFLEMVSKHLEIDKTMSKVSQPPQSQPPPSKHDRSDLRNFLGRALPRSTAAGGSKEVSHTSPENSSPGSTSNPGLQSRRSQTRPRNSQSSPHLHAAAPFKPVLPRIRGRLFLSPPCRSSSSLHAGMGIITSDPWVLSAVKGYALELDHQPHQVHAPYQRALSSEPSEKGGLDDIYRFEGCVHVGPDPQEVAPFPVEGSTV